MDSWIIYFLIALVTLCLFKYTFLGYYAKVLYYGFCLVIGGMIGGVVSIPFGKTTNNHFRMFKIFQFLCQPLGVKYYLRNAEILQDPKPYIIIANHQSALDVLGMSYAWPVNCVVMLKSSLRFLPGFNLCAYLCESVYINRFSKGKAKKTVDNTLNEIVTKKRKVWIYPEGTRNSEEKMLPFKKGAFILAKQANIPIVPCVFSSHRFFYSCAEKRFTNGQVNIDILPEVDSSKFETVDELLEHCYRIMQEHREKMDQELLSANK
ncbi:unnamed protein product [Caenorhabditis bovis]|uniref:1-acyl-sn-glycerol-3-phosphate acyltransferase n=1 Tax=Caenorhabditis bovis TaxID=2654633 RepID=A0A8S1EQ03_9PELO|nr:unnamed protein product [Caenorhabditis bovis]